MVVTSLNVSLAAFSSTATGVPCCERQSPWTHFLARCCCSDCSAVCSNMVPSPFAFSRCDACSLAGLYFNRSVGKVAAFGNQPIWLYLSGFSVAAQYCSPIWSKVLIQFVTRNSRVDRGEITEGSAGRLVVQEHAEEATVNRQPDAVLGYKAMLLELISRLSAFKASRKPCKRWPHPLRLLSIGDPRPPDVALGCTPS